MYETLEGEAARGELQKNRVIMTCFGVGEVSLETVDNIYLGKWGVVYVSEYLPIVRYSPLPPFWKKIRYTKKPDGMVMKEEAYFVMWNFEMTQKYGRQLKTTVWLR